MVSGNQSSVYLAGDFQPAVRARGASAPSGYRYILLVNPPQEAIGAEFMMEDTPLRLEYIAAYIRGHVGHVEVVDLTRERRPLSGFLRRFRPDLVGISVNYMSAHTNALELARVSKAAGADVVVGGYQATALAEEFASHPDVDFVVRGEGEATMLDLVQGRMPIDRIRGVSFSRRGAVVHNPPRAPISDLDSLPVPERHLRRAPYELPFTDLEGGVATGYEMIVSSRGCGGRCKFCTEPMMSGGKQRYRSPAKVVEEIEGIVRLHAGKKRLRLHIADPNFGGNPRVAEELCDRLIEFRKRCPMELRIFISVRTSTVANNPKLVRKMAGAGVDYVFVGMESPRKRDLKAVSKHGENRGKQERAVRHLTENGIAIMSCFLLGLPEQTEQDVWDMFDYARGLGLEDCYFSVMTPLPGSRLYSEALESGRLVETDSSKYRLFDMLLKHDHMSRSKVTEMCVRCNARWYDDLMLRQEHRRWVSSGRRKKKLFDFAKKFNVLVGFFSSFGSRASETYDDLDPSNFVRDLPNPGLRSFTERTGIHNYLEMGRFLRILGEQKIQVSVEPNGSEGDVVSWVMKTKPSGVEYVEAIRGRAEAPSISINIGMSKGELGLASIASRILRDNDGARSRFNLSRFAAAAGAEVIAFAADRASEAARRRGAGLFCRALK